MDSGAKQEPGPIERSAIRKVTVRLVPFLALMFFINSWIARRSRLPRPTG
ncbi:Protein of unknown function [Propionibacterium freudenreichii]|nr:Protein of unknown function [Propionibacterium freudenreichii]